SRPAQWAGSDPSRVPPRRRVTVQRVRSDSASLRFLNTGWRRGGGWEQGEADRPSPPPPSSYRVLRGPPMHDYFYGRPAARGHGGWVAWRRGLGDGSPPCQWAGRHEA